MKVKSNSLAARLAWKVPYNLLTVSYRVPCKYVNIRPGPDFWFAVLTVVMAALIGILWAN